MANFKGSKIGKNKLSPCSKCGTMCAAKKSGNSFILCMSCISDRINKKYKK